MVDYASITFAKQPRQKKVLSGALKSRPIVAVADFSLDPFKGALAWQVFEPIEDGSALANPRETEPS